MLSPLARGAVLDQILVVEKATCGCGDLMDPFAGLMSSVCVSVQNSALLLCYYAKNMDVGFVFSLPLTLIFVPLLTL